MLGILRGGGDLAQAASADNPDPWQVAEALCLLGEFDAAAAFAAAAPRAAVAKLPDYVAARRVAAPDEGIVEALRALDAAMAANSAEAVFAAGSGLGGPPDSVSRLRIAYARGLALQNLRRYAESAKLLHEAACAARDLGWIGRAMLTFGKSGFSAYHAGNRREAIGEWREGLALARTLGDRRQEADLLNDLGVAHRGLGESDAALECYRQSLALWQAANGAEGQANAWNNIGVVHLSRGDFKEALHALRQAEDLKANLPDRASYAMTVNNTGIAMERLGDADGALEAYRKALEISDGVRDLPGIGRALGSLGNLHAWRFEYEKAFQAFERALSVFAEANQAAGAAETFGNLGRLHRELGEFDEAYACQKKALALFERIENPWGMVLSRLNMGSVLVAQGRLTLAIEEYRLAQDLATRLGDKSGIARTHELIGEARLQLGQADRALDEFGSALAVYEAQGDARAVCGAHVRIADAFRRLGDPARALGGYEKALALAAGDRVREAEIRTSQGASHAAAGRSEEALAAFRGALAIADEVGHREMALTNRISIGDLLREEGRWEAAEACYAEVLGALPEAARRARALMGLALAHVGRGQWTQAIARALEARREVEAIVSGLSDEEGASGREDWTEVYDIGAAASGRTGDLALMFTFLEAGRGQMLVEALRAAATLRAALLPPHLSRALAAAEQGERRAREKLHEALATQRREQIAAARAALDKAREVVRGAGEDLQRGAKLAAAVVAPEPSSLADVQARLREGDLLVHYLLAPTGAVALLVERGGARQVALGDRGRILAACSPVVGGDLGEGPIATLRSLLVEPLRLGEKVRRLLVAPAGPLAYIPFPLLSPEREVAYLPSGTTYLLLHESEGAAGEGVLAIGDPEAPGVAPLPASRQEVEAVGTVTLVGKEATEARFRAALGSRARWAAVHFACHGRIDAERPTLSALVLAPDAADDGMLTCLDAFRLRIPADLAVLSACETAKGRLFQSEGIVGLTRAFMYAGTPRVIVSLWKVDDAATRALMVRFYAEWRGGAGAGLALRRAQSRVAATPGWAPPRYWAAWQLWGLPD